MNADWGRWGRATVLGLAALLRETRINPIKMQQARQPVSHRSAASRRDAEDRESRLHAEAHRRLGAARARDRRAVSGQLERGEPSTWSRTSPSRCPSRSSPRCSASNPSGTTTSSAGATRSSQVATGSARGNPLESGLLDHFGDLFSYLRGTVKRRRARAPADDLVSLLVDPSQDGVLDELDMVHVRRAAVGRRQRDRPPT